MMQNIGERKGCMRCMTTTSMKSVLAYIDIKYCYRHSRYSLHGMWSIMDSKVVLAFCMVGYFSVHGTWNRCLELFMWQNQW